MISPWWWVRGDYPKKHFRRVNDWNLPRSSQIYPALIIPFYIPFYISPIKWILDIPIFQDISHSIYIYRYPQDIPNFTRKSAGLGSWDHRSSQRFGDFAGQGYSVTPHGIPQKTVLVGGYVMWFMWFMWGYFTYMYIYICWWFSDMLYDFVIGVLYEVATVGFCSILGGWS